MQFFSSDKRLQEIFFQNHPPPPPRQELNGRPLRCISCSTIFKLCSKCKTATQNVKMFKALNLLSLTALLKNLLVNSLLFRVLCLKIPCPFALAIRNAPLTHEDESSKLAAVISVVTNNKGKLGQVTPHVSPSSLQLQVFQPWTDHDEEAKICQKSKSAFGTAV